GARRRRPRTGRSRQRLGARGSLPRGRSGEAQSARALPAPGRAQDGSRTARRAGPRGRPRAAPHALPGRARRARTMARIVVAGAGAIGASIAYHLVRRETDEEVIPRDRGQVACGATGKAMGGVRQQFPTKPEVRLAQASARFLAGLGPPPYEQGGYLFPAATGGGLAAL